MVYVTVPGVVPLLVRFWEIVVPEKPEPVVAPVIAPETEIVQVYVDPPTVELRPIEVLSPLQISGELLVAVSTGIGLTTTDVLPEVKLVQPLDVTVAV